MDNIIPDSIIDVFIKRIKTHIEDGADKDHP